LRSSIGAKERVWGRMGRTSRIKIKSRSRSRRGIRSRKRRSRPKAG